MLFLCRGAFSADSSTTRLDIPELPQGDDLGRILDWGSRPWESRSIPLIVNPLNGCERPGCAAYFILDAADLRKETIRLPKTPRERAFVTALQNTVQKDGPAHWPILVFSAPDSRPVNSSFSPLASTRRIVLCDQTEVCRPAAAILLNSLYWGVSDPPITLADQCMEAMVARHELYHAKRVWQHARKAVVLANAIEERLRTAGIFRVDRNRLEMAVSQAIAAKEEIEATDLSLGSTVLLPVQRLSIVRYGRDNVVRLSTVLKRLEDLFTERNKPGERQELGRWFDALFQGN